MQPLFGFRHYYSSADPPIAWGQLLNQNLSTCVLLAERNLPALADYFD